MTYPENLPLVIAFIPLALCSIAATAIIAERALVFARLRRPRAVVERLAARSSDALAPAELEAAAAKGGFCSAAIAALAAHSGRAKPLRDEAATIALAECAAPLTARLNGLATIAALAPMLGLLGTVTGMMFAFQAMESHAGPVEPAVIAGGLWQAMITTAAGLIIAVPCLIAHAFFRSAARARIARAERLLSRFSLALETGGEHP
ncbi:MotA/TolQ/ExbB proton channel [Glycocaulis alkaliphilus]|uniref:MotA/TolQ/ExbB proton channel n=1 Tax=Glycocaulis alkaliphilus TaxID=1434191 RepID=A0A3T0EAT7_9PROT|nr:MotA/TolQ/ExbB proton channel family protein [Glycocaulis alkaliphilus]AZU04429.1 MotA/TolQ/ExbB proton channel [Glycocaulis alkaliphilus]GGB78312.1 flagellar motor protein MotA [Glycocaulis alkaliphilus]